MRFNTFLILIFFTINALSAGTYFKPPALIEGFTTVASAAGTTTLTRASETKLIITGATTQTVVLPDATTMSTELGRRFYIINKSSGNVTVNASGGGLLTTLSTGTQAEIHLRAAGSAAGTWDVLSSSGGGGGTWGSITGTLSSQTDLQSALDLKAPLASPTFTGTITTPLVTNKAVVTNGSGALTASATSATQVGYLSNISQDVQTSLDAKTDKSTLTTKGDLYVATGSATVARQAVGSNGQMLIADSTQTNGVRWAADPDGNLIPDGNAEFGITNFVEGSYSAATRPAGTFTSSSGSGSFAISTSTSAPLFGATSFLLTKSSGSSRQGRAIERTISIDAGYRTKMLKTRIDYTIVSGSFVAGSNGSSPTDSSLIWYVGQYNGSTWSYTEPSTFKMFSKSTTNSDFVEGEFQVKSDTTQIKLIGFISESANSAWVVKAEVGIKPSTYAAGTTITDWVAYTPTITGLGTVSGLSAFWRRVGDESEIKMTFGSGTNTAVLAKVSLPSGQSGNTSKVANNTIVGKASASATPFSAGLLFGSSDPTNLYITSDSANYTVGSNGTVWSNSTTFGLFASVPITGWSSSSQVSDGYDARLIAGTYKTLSSTTITSGTALRFTTIVEDKTASYNTGTGATVIPSQGTYEFNIGGINAGAVTDVKMFIGASDMGVIGSLATGTGRQSIVIQHPFSAGDSVTFVPQTSGTASDTVGWMTFRKLQGPTTISATELTQFYTYTGSPTGTLSGSYNTVTYGTGGTYYDTHGAYSGGVYTLRKSGCFDIKGSVQITHTTAAGFLDVGISFNGVAPFVADYKYVTGNGDTTQSVTGTMCGKSGDNFRIQVKTNLTTPAYSSGAAYNYFILSERK